MAYLGMMIGGLLMAGSLAWVGVQGLRGIPDAKGKQTSKGTAMTCLVLAVLIAVSSVGGYFYLASTAPRVNLTIPTRN